MLFAFVIMSWPEKKSRHVFEEVCKMIGWSLLRQKLLPDRLKVKWKQKQDCEVPEGLQERQSFLACFCSLNSLALRACSFHPQDKLIFLGKFSIEQ